MNQVQYFNYHIPYHPYSRVYSSIKFLPVTNCQIGKLARKGDYITLFCHDLNGRISKVGNCIVAGPLIKYSQIDKEQQQYCTDTYCLQLPVCEITARGFYFDGLLMQYCNTAYEDIPFKPRKMTVSYWCEDKIKYTHYEKFWYIWQFCFDKQIVDKYRKLVVHLYRDNIINERSPYRHYLNTHENRCSVCGMVCNDKFWGSQHFWELHDTTEDIMHPLRKNKISQDNILILCPSCHRLVHFRMVPDDLAENEQWYGGYANLFYGECMNWSQIFTDDYNQRYSH